MAVRHEQRRLREIIRLGAQLNDFQDLDILLERILRDARRIVNADAGTIYTRDGDYLDFKYAQCDTLQNRLPQGDKLHFESYKVKIDRKSVSGYVADSGEILNIPDMYAIPENSPYHFDPSYDRKNDYKTISTLTVPLKTNRNEIIGVLQIINARDKNGTIIAFLPEDEPFMIHFSSLASMVLQRAQMTRILLLRMISMAELRDPKETGPHVNRVGSYAVEIYERWATYKKIPREVIDKNRDSLRMAAMLHDVGKVAISDTILKKAARFTEAEYEIIKQHTYCGARLFTHAQSEFDDVATQVALTHHENWDGTGYPGFVDIETGTPLETVEGGKARPRKGEEIPIFGRVVALADVYDALSCKRVYKEPWSEKDVLKEIKDLSGTKFDPDCVDVFFECLPIIKMIRMRYPDKD
ncbi:MAG: HD domain-containing protein [Spirochaetales bacterium]|nr:HD domain-containing protein [Spirochaetales bacterium]